MGGGDGDGLVGGGEGEGLGGGGAEGLGRWLGGDSHRMGWVVGEGKGWVVGRWSLKSVGFQG